MSTATLQPSMEHATGEAPQMTNRVELDSQALTLVRRVAARALPWPASEDFSGELLCRWIDEAKSVGRPNMVRRDWLKPRWITLEARTYAARMLRPEQEELVLDTTGDEDESPRGETANWRRLHEADDSHDMEDEDFSEPTLGGPEWSPKRVRMMAGRLARELHVTDHDDAVYALIQALAPVSVGEAKRSKEAQAKTIGAKELAAIFELSLSAWQGKVKRGAAHIRACYPANHPTINLAKLAREIVRVTSDGKDIARRDTELADRKLGRKLPADSHRNHAQLAREADWLIARPQLDGRVADAARASHDASRTGRQNDAANTVPAPAEAEVWTVPVSFHISPAWQRSFARGIAALGEDRSQRRGAPTGRQAPGFKMRGKVRTSEPNRNRPVLVPGPEHGPITLRTHNIRESMPLLAAWSGYPLNLENRPRLTAWKAGTGRTMSARKPLAGPTAMIPQTWLPASLRELESRTTRPELRSLDVAWPERDEDGRVTDREHWAFGRKLKLISGV